MNLLNFSFTYKLGYLSNGLNKSPWWEWNIWPFWCWAPHIKHKCVAKGCEGTLKPFLKNLKAFFLVQIIICRPWCWILVSNLYKSWKVLWDVTIQSTLLLSVMWKMPILLLMIIFYQLNCIVDAIATLCDEPIF